MSDKQNGIVKAAVLLMALEEDDAAVLLGKLPPKQVELVSLAIAQLDNISGQIQEEIISEFFGGEPRRLDIPVADWIVLRVW